MGVVEVLNIAAIGVRKYQTYLAGLSYLQKQCRYYNKDIVKELDGFIKYLNEKELPDEYKDLGKELEENRDGIVDWINLMATVNDSVDNWDFSDEPGSDAGLAYIDGGDLSGQERAEFIRKEFCKSREYYKYALLYTQDMWDMHIYTINERN